MASKSDLQDWIVQTLEGEQDGAAHHVSVARKIWERHEAELRASGDLFYTWQYDLRWAAKKLRDSGELESVTGSGKGDGVWRLRTNSRSH